MILLDIFKQLNLKSSYETGENDLINEFYIPVLSCAVSYDRIAGFFSSSSLAIAAKGIAGLISNNGKMRLLACPRLNERDAEVLEEVSENPMKFLDEKLASEFENIEDGFQNDHIKALGWMIANNYLEIKIALVKNNGRFYTQKQVEKVGIFHQKVGIMKDINGDRISFSGSINETASGWLDNIEEFKVFKSWNEEGKYLKDDEEKFNSFWENKREFVCTYSLPETIRNNLIEKSKDFKVEDIIVEQYKKYMGRKKINNLHLFPYQKDAVNKWKENDYQLLFQMATGTGKTRTAIGCMAELLSLPEKLVVVVSCPQGTLSLQWKSEVNKSGIEFEKDVIIDGTNRNWKNDFKKSILEIEVGLYENMIVYTTHITCSKNEFKNIIEESDKKIKFLFIGDEAHGLGALTNRKGLLDRYNYRIGLSATPSRWFDDYGTMLIENYFGNNIFLFSINDALTTVNPMTGKTFLVQYNYYIEFINLTKTELSEYEKITMNVKKLAKLSQMSDEYTSGLENLLFKRANIIKSAENKYKMLVKILNDMSEIKDLIIFVSNDQLEIVKKILNDMNILAHHFTQEVGTKPEERFNGITERQNIINNFKEGHYKVLIAIKCLDEGIDIPSAQNAILMASSTNPREYIQRIGRVIRRSQGKKEANIWDITIRPCNQYLQDNDLINFEKMICDKEKNRIYDIVENAKNGIETLKVLYDELGE